VSCYGSDLLTTPHVDELAARGVRFTDCQSVVPITGPSHASILTGLYPQVHGAFRNGVPVHGDVPTLAELLRASGYRTGAVVAGWTLKASQCGLSRGFETYDDNGMEQRYDVVNLMRRADAVTDAALAWTGKVRTETPGSPWFLFLHYFDPHEPYESPLPADPPKNAAARDLPAPPERSMLGAYDREIAFSDRELGRFLDALRERGELDRTLVVFTADHGQCFGEHGYGGAKGAHGRRVYQALLASPVVMAGPGIAPGTLNELPTTHLDLLPTIAQIAGVEPAKVPPACGGQSLATVLANPSAAPPWGRARRVRYALAYRGAVGNKWNIFRWAQNKDSETAVPLYACAVLDGRKVIVDMQKPENVELFDLSSDPTESRALTDATDATKAKSWASDVLGWYDRTRTDLKAVPPTGTDLENLRSLGYVDE
jgi:arylsulfatase A-like enzyme